MESKTLFLVHGFMGSALNWGPVITKLKNRPELLGWRFVTADLLGHGGRRGPDALPYKKLDHQHVCEDLKLQIPEGKFVALGHSFGIRPLLSLSLDPDIGPRMEALLIEDATPEITQENYLRLKGIIDSIPVPFANRDDARAAIESLFPGNRNLAAFLFSNIRRNEAGEHSWRFDKDGLLNLLEEAFRLPLWSEWSNYSGRLVLFRGENSDHLDQERLDKALHARGSKSVQLVQISESGHWIHSEQVDKFVEELAKVLIS